MNSAVEWFDTENSGDSSNLHCARPNALAAQHFADATGVEFNRQSSDIFDRVRALAGENPRTKFSLSGAGGTARHNAVDT